MGLWMFRALFAVLLIVAAFSLKPFDISSQLALVVGVSLAISIILFEVKARHYSARVLIGAVAGSLVGILAAALMSVVIGNMTAFSSRTESFFQFLALIALIYVGLSVGATKGDLLNLSFAGFKKKPSLQKSPQDPRYQRHHRRTCCRHPGYRFPGGPAATPTVRSSRAADGGRFSRFHEEKPGTTGPGHHGQDPEKVGRLGQDYRPGLP